MTDLAAQWRKASTSYSNTQCVEVAEFCGVVLVRDSKDPTGPQLRFGRPELRRFVEGVKAQ